MGDLVTGELDRIAEEGNGAMRQRRAWQRRHDVSDVIAEAAANTLAGT
jgi:carboxylate-amine ligase